MTNIIILILRQNVLSTANRVAVDSGDMMRNSNQAKRWGSLHLPLRKNVYGFILRATAFFGKIRYQRNLGIALPQPHEAAEDLINPTRQRLKIQYITANILPTAMGRRAHYFSVAGNFAWQFWRLSPVFFGSFSRIHAKGRYRLPVF